MDCGLMLEKNDIKVSVPCRIDLGGTLDISTFSLPLNHLDPSTFNIALDMRTRIKLSTWKKGYVKICSRGFESAEFKAGKACFDHPLGLMFAVAAYFNANGVCIEIDSASPPKSALGGSSVAAVGIVSAFLKMQQFNKHNKYKFNSHENMVDDVCADDCSSEAMKKQVLQAPVIAHYIEAGVAGVPCGFQDQLAAAYGGINTWHWFLGSKGPSFKRESIFPGSDCAGAVDEEVADGGMKDYELLKTFNNNILVAYCGIPHVSKDINQRWVEMFLLGKNRDKWEEICRITMEFSECIKSGKYFSAGILMNRETRLRLEMTPDVLDETGRKLFMAAEQYGCGARFTGAGGGGCLWAVGETENIENLKREWEILIAQKDQAILLDTKIDPDGILFE